MLIRCDAYHKFHNITYYERRKQSSNKTDPAIAIAPEYFQNGKAKAMIPTAFHMNSVLSSYFSILVICKRLQKLRLININTQVGERRSQSSYLSKKEKDRETALPYLLS